MSQPMDRRIFIKQALKYAAGMAALSAGGLAFRRDAQAASGTPGYINIIGRAPGGWDSFRYHNTFLAEDLEGFKNLKTAPNAAAGGLIDSFDENGKLLFTQRFASDQAWKNRGTLFGPEFKQFSPFIDRMLVIRGLVATGGHGFGQHILQTGTISPYGASASSRISLAMEEQFGRRSLHYVQIANSPGELNTSAGLLHGSAKAVNISDQSAWASLSVQSKDELPTTQRSLLDVAVSEITNLLKPSLLKGSSRDTYQSFNESFTGANDVNKSGFGTSKEFLDLVVQYQQNALKAMKDVQTNPLWRDFVRPAIIPTTYLSEAFGFAMAEFLIRKNLSYVVDVPVTIGDNHNLDDSHFYNLAAAYSFFNTLITNLDGKKTPDGKSFLDWTTVSFATEFDRTPSLWAESPSSLLRPGSGHGETTSVLLIGGNVKAGVAGGVKSGPSGPYGAFVHQGFGTALPINLKTGQPDVNGTLVSQESFFPTMLGLFKIPVPDEQQTGNPALEFAIK